MKKHFLLFLLTILCLSTEVYGQKSDTKKFERFTPWGVYAHDPFLPRRDTVIMLGEEIEVGGFLSELVVKEIEIIGYGKSKKSDLKKIDGAVYKRGAYIIKLKPKNTTTYEFKWVDLRSGDSQMSGRIVYVAKTAEEKKQLEEKLKASLVSPYQATTYQRPSRGGIKITSH